METPEEFLYNKGICSDTTIGVEADYLLTDLLKEYQEISEAAISNNKDVLKFQIQNDIKKTKEALKTIRENTARSFEDASGWVQEINLTEGEVQGLTKALDHLQ